MADSPRETRKMTAAGVQVRLVRNVTELEALEPQWKALYEISPSASASLRWEWVRQWWRVYGAAYGGEDGLRILTVWRRSKLIGVLGLYQCAGKSSSLGVRRLRFLSTGEAGDEETCANYLDLLYEPSSARVCLDAIAETLAEMHKEWDEILLSSISENSPLMAWQYANGDAKQKVTTREQGVCHVSSLERGFEAYLTGLGSSTRAESRRLLRSADSAGVKLEMAADEASVDAHFEDLISLHQKRWNAEGKAGCFAAPRFTEFHKGLARQLVPNGKAVLARLSQGEKALAVFFGHRVRGKFELYVSGIEPGEVQGVKSPGTAAHLLLMSDLAGRGVTHYDHLMSGGPTYKQRFGTQQQKLVEMRIVRPGMRIAIESASKFVRRASARGLKMVCRA